MAGDLSKLRAKFLLGAVAGNLALPGIKKGARIIQVSVLDFTLAEAAPNVRTWSAPLDLTAEFTATADDVINNTGGTSSAGKLVHVLYEVLENSWVTGQQTGRSKY